MTALPRRFHLVRDEDETGTSGTGVIVEGIEFLDGTIALRWLTATTSTAIYDSIEDVIAIHGHGGKTRVAWVDPMAPRPERPIFPGPSPILPTAHGIGPGATSHPQ